MVDGVRPGNRPSGATYSPRVLLAKAAAAQVQQASAETVVTAVVNVTDGLDVSNINATLAAYNDRITALEEIPP